MSIRAVIVDDEPLARDRLRELCGEEPDVSVVGEATHSLDALRQLEQLRPNLVLLDVQLRGTSGIAMLRELSGARPLVVIVSAYEQYALEAFDVAAVDYLVKPCGRERFRLAMRRVRERIADSQGESLAVRIADTLRSVGNTPSEARPKRIVVEHDGRLMFVSQDDIHCVIADRNYVTIHCGRQTYSLRWTMQQAVASLDASRFLRVHRSVIINCEQVREMTRWFHGEYLIVLTNDQRVTSGRSFSPALRARIKNTA
jgi:two-component system, LytTR family, response regulator